MNVSVSGSFLRPGGKLIDTERRLFDVSLHSHAVPPVVIQGGARLHCYLQWSIAHIKRENNLRGSWKRE